MTPRNQNKPLREKLGWRLMETPWPEGERMPLRYWIGAGLMHSWFDGIGRGIRGVPAVTPARVPVCHVCGERFVICDDCHARPEGEW